MKKVVAIYLLFTLLFVTGCVDLGSPQSFEEYYEIFGDASFVCQSDNPHPQIDNVEIDKLYNQNTSEKLFSVMEEGVYKYIAIPINKNVRLEDIAVYFKSQEFEGKLSLEIYLRSGFPDSFFGDMYVDKIEGKYTYARTKQGRDVYGNPIITIDYLDLYFDGYGTVTDESGHTSSYTLTYDEGYPLAIFTFTYTQEVNNVTQNITRDYQCAFVTQTGEIDYDNVTVVCTDRDTNQIVMKATYKYKGISNPVPEAGLTNLIGSVSLTLKKDTWNSFVLGNFVVDEKKVNGVDASAGDYIFIKVLNNCAGAHRKKLDPLAFEITNAVVRSKEMEET